MNVIRKIFGKTKIDRIRSQQIREFCNIKSINERMERRRESDDYTRRMDGEGLVKISRDKICR